MFADSADAGLPLGDKEGLIVISSRLDSRSLTSISGEQRRRTVNDDCVTMSVHLPPRQKPPAEGEFDDEVDENGLGPHIRAIPHSR